MVKIIRWLSRLLIFLLISGWFPPAVPAQTGPAKKGRVVMVVMDSLTWEDFREADLPVLKKLASDGAVSLMTTNPAGGHPRIADNTYATIGAGAKVSGSKTSGGRHSGGLGFNSWEAYEGDNAGAAFSRRTGLSAGDRQVVHLGIAEMERANLGLKYGYSLGAIGTVLHQHGLKTAVLGNADLPGLRAPEERYRRQAVTIAMDNRGLVDYGNVSAKMYQFDSYRPAGVKTDYQALLKEFADLYQKADFIVVETGDPARIEEMAHLMADEALLRQKKQVLTEIDDFLGRLLKLTDPARDLLIVAVPDPPNQAMEEGNFLTPLLMAGKGVEKGAVGWSGTVKRNGLVANIDLAAKVLDHLGLPPVVEGTGAKKDIRLSGQVIQGRQSADPFAEITKLGEDAVFLYTSRYPLVKTYLNAGLVVLIISIAAAWAVAAAGRRKKISRYLAPLLVALTVVPGILLWANFLPHPSIGIVGLEILALTVVVTWLVMVLGRRNLSGPYLIVTGLTGLLVTADILAGAPLAKTSPFSYDVMSGARFYGIGNEYMGVLIGCTLVFTGLALDRWRIRAKFIKSLAVVLYLAVIYVIAAPNLGTNVGGTIAAVAGFGAAGLILSGARLNKKTVFLILFALAVIMAGFICSDLTRAVSSQSHIGRTITLIRENGFTEITNIISRKWEVNFKLIKGTTWSWFYLLSLLAILLGRRLLPGETGRFAAAYPWFSKFLTAVIFASLAALIFNDSGVTAATTIMIYAIAPYLTGLLEVGGDGRT